MVNHFSKHFPKLPKFLQINSAETIFGVIAEYPAQQVVFNSTATVVCGPQSASKVICT